MPHVRLLSPSLSSQQKLFFRRDLTKAVAHVLGLGAARRLALRYIALDPSQGARADLGRALGAPPVSLHLSGVDLSPNQRKALRKKLRALLALHTGTPAEAVTVYLPVEAPSLSRGPFGPPLYGYYRPAA